MVLPGANRELWPIRIEPLTGELLSSWIVRLAHAHGMRAETFVTAVFGCHWPLWTRDIDRSASDASIQVLSQITGVESQALHEHTLRSYEGVLAQSVNPKGGSGGILPLGIYHRTRRRRGLMFCPDCLAGDAVPFFRKAWRVTYLCVCPSHGWVLRDCCPACEAPLAPHRVDVKWRLQTTVGSQLHLLCWQCGWDLRSADDRQPAGPSDTLLAQCVAQGLEAGYAWVGAEPVYGPAFFDGVRALAGVWRKYANVTTRGARLIDDANLAERRALLGGVGQWLEDWPVSFLGFARAKRVKWSDVVQRGRPVPYWLHRIGREHLLCKAAPIGQDEADAIAQHAARVHGTSNLRLARDVSGRHLEARHLPAHRRRQTSHLSYEALLAHVDHLIAGETDRARRHHLLADKVLVAAARILSLSQVQLSRMTTADLQCLARSGAPDFWRVPTTARQFGPWANWYLCVVRPVIARSGTASAFLRRDGRAGLSANGIGARLSQLVNGAMLAREIPDYRTFASRRW